MKKQDLYITWGVLYALCVGLSCIPSPTGVVAGLCVIAALGFFVPPALLLHWAIPRKRWQTVRQIRNISLLSLVLTLGVLVLNFLSVGAGDGVGQLLYGILILVSCPMICVQAWVVSLFLWACLLMTTLMCKKK